ncbi:hypothetical protein PJL18_03756 [Paenarthrobacter nicotinovorans]|nr:hypothetical protein [Paenarthrobacter nicotinovorans]
MRNRPSAGDIHQVNAPFCRSACQPGRVSHLHAAVGPVGGRDAQEKRHRIGNDFPDSLHHCEHEPVPALLVSTPAVRTGVDERALELMQKIPMGAVDFDSVEANGHSPGGRCGKVGHDTLDVLFAHGRRRRIAVIGLVRWTDCRPAAVVRRDRTRTFRERPVSGGLPPCVRQLGTDPAVHGAVPVHELHDPFPSGSLFIRIEAGIQRADPAHRVDSRRLTHDQRSASGGEGTQVHQVPVVRNPLTSLRMAAVLAHRRDPTPVRDGQRTQGERRKQRRSH